MRRVNTHDFCSFYKVIKFIIESPDFNYKSKINFNHFNNFNDCNGFNHLNHLNVFNDINDINHQKSNFL